MYKQDNFTVFGHRKISEFESHDQTPKGSMRIAKCDERQNASLRLP